MILQQEHLFDCVFRFTDLKEERERLGRQQSPPAETDADAMKDLPSSEQEGSIPDISREHSEDSKPVPLDVGKVEEEERGRSVDETSHKNRSKRESRRMRELEQAQFSLELLKVRTTSTGGPPQEDLVPDSSILQLEDHLRHSPQRSPASHRSIVEDMDSESQVIAPQECTHTLDVPQQEELRDSNYNEKLPTKMEGPRATFYIASDQSPVHEPKFESPSKLYKDRRESLSRRPLVVLISMQKESPVEEGELLAAQTSEGTQAATFNSNMTPIAGLEVASELEQPHGMDIQAKREEPSPSALGSGPELSGICSSEMGIQITLEPRDNDPPVLQQERTETQSTQEAPSPVLDSKPPKAQRKSSAQTVIVNMVEKPSNTVFSPPRRKLPFSK